MRMSGGMRGADNCAWEGILTELVARVRDSQELLQLHTDAHGRGDAKGVKKLPGCDHLLDLLLQEFLLCERLELGFFLQNLLLQIFNCYSYCRLCRRFAPAHHS